MKAARLYQTGTQLRVEANPEPVLQSGGAIVRVSSSHIPAFTQRVFSGELGYMLPEPFPFTPGTSAIGVVDAISDDTFGVQVGQRVFCDPFMAAPSLDGSQNSILIGWIGLTAASAKLQTLWKDGVWAEKALWPAECLTPIPEMQGVDAAALAAIGYLAIPYGGFLRGQLCPGQQVIINGATGGLGSAAVLVALAMGAARIVAVGRNEAYISLSGNQRCNC